MSSWTISRPWGPTPLLIATAWTSSTLSWESRRQRAPVFALIALLLAAIGLYAVMAHSISQRTKEIGVRVALGATAQDIRRLIFREGMRPVVLGLIAGLTISPDRESDSGIATRRRLAVRSRHVG